MLSMGPTNQITYLIQHLSSVMGKQTDQLLQQQLGIGFSQYRILTALEWNPRVQQKTIADNLGQTEASISRQIKLLEDRGYVSVKADETNRRKHIIVPTPMGMQITEAANAIIRRSLGPDYATLGGTKLQRMIKDLQAMHDIVCAPGQPGACDHTMGI